MNEIMKHFRSGIKHRSIVGAMSLLSRPLQETLLLRQSQAAAVVNIFTGAGATGNEILSQV